MAKELYIQTLDAPSLALAVSQMLSGLATSLRPDVLTAMEQALALETSGRAQSAMSMLLDNACIAAGDQVPLCQDTGSVWVLLEVGSDASGQPIRLPSDIFSLVDEAVSQAWRQQALRPSMVLDALLDRANSNHNTPAFCDVALTPQLTGARLSVMLKGGGSDNASLLAMLAPGDGWPSIVKLVVDQVRAKGPNACPPLVIGIGVGSTFDHVAALAKQALLRPLGTPNPDPRLAALEAEMLDAVNQVGLGPGGLGGATTALGVNIVTAPCHIAALPVAINLGCCAMRSASCLLTGDWP
jgi:tartrate/fumarate subfamily iron-sulfur-dependent hydro-lyase alpha chain